jgi:hypothetical protein
MNIDDYFELYLKTRIKYDREYHIKNCGYDFSKVNDTLVKKIFNYIDMVIFSGKMTEYVKQHKVNLFFEVSDALTSSAGLFVRYGNGEKFGIKISGKFFQNIIDKNILNINLGVVDENNQKYLSKYTIEPLFTTIEHEMIHMLMFMTRHNKHSDIHKVKSGHTANFKRLIYNIFGHYKISHEFGIGDSKENVEKKKEIQIGDYVKMINKDFSGYVVGIKDKFAILCHIKSDGSTKYLSAIYKNLVKIENDNTDKTIDVNALINMLKVGKRFMFNGNTYKIIQVNKTTITVERDDDKSKGKTWKMAKFGIIDYKFI